MNRQLAIAVATLLLCLLVAGGTLAQGTATINRWVISGEGAPSSGGSVALNDTLGQPVIGPSSGGDVSLQAGYWGAGAVEEGPPPPPPIPVGGYTVPVSKLKLLEPWMGLVALMGLLVTGMAVVFRKHTRR